MNRRYAGVGSRNTPGDVRELMQRLAEKLSRNGWTLRSGGAAGADRAFETGARRAGGRAQVFRPHHLDKLGNGAQAMRIAASLHPAWSACREFARRLHGRNAYQVLGADLKTPATFVVCWTPDGCKTHAQRNRRTGGTGTAISIADRFGVPVFNLADPADRRRIERWVE